MKNEFTGWSRLVAAARQLPDDRDTAAPYGFSTRVAALAMAPERQVWRSLFDRLSWRALGVAGVLALLSVATNFASAGSSTDDDVLSDGGAVAALFDIS